MKLLPVAVLAFVAVVACSNSTTTPAPKTFDAGNGSCSDAADGTVTCNSGPPTSRPSGACEATQTLCWTIGVFAPTHGTGSNNALCAACCSGTNAAGGPNASYNGAEDCTIIACGASDGCPYESSCVSNVCN